jgi:inward rectifier potassium channel
MTFGRMVTLDGRFNVVRVGIPNTLRRDLYHWLLTLSWPVFLGLQAVLFFLANIVFAIAYVLGGNGIANAEPGSLLDAFFFSVQTMASIGYGAMHPTTDYTNFIVSIEALVGLLGLAIATGLVFARVSRPTAQVLFSDRAVVETYHGVPTLMFRSTNQRQNRILEAQMQAVLVQNDISPEGHQMRRFYNLDLVRSDTPIFALTWMSMHQINEHSPLYGKTAEDLQKADAEIVVTLTGLDETFAQTIHARHSYVPGEIVWNARFVDIFSRRNGQLIIDYTKFHSVTPMLPPYISPTVAANRHDSDHDNDPPSETPYPTAPPSRPNEDSAKVIVNNGSRGQDGGEG